MYFFFGVYGRQGIISFLGMMFCPYTFLFLFFGWRLKCLYWIVLRFWFNSLIGWTFDENGLFFISF